jgi:hypothetical protein
MMLYWTENEDKTNCPVFISDIVTKTHNNNNNNNNISMALVH